MINQIINFTKNTPANNLILEISDENANGFTVAICDNRIETDSPLYELFINRSDFRDFITDRDDLDPKQYQERDEDNNVVYIHEYDEISYQYENETELLNFFKKNPRKAEVINPRLQVA